MPSFPAGGSTSATRGRHWVSLVERAKKTSGVGICERESIRRKSEYDLLKQIIYTPRLSAWSAISSSNRWDCLTCTGGKSIKICCFGDLRRKAEMLNIWVGCWRLNISSVCPVFDISVNEFSSSFKPSHPVCSSQMPFRRGMFRMAASRPLACERTKNKLFVIGEIVCHLSIDTSTGRKSREGRGKTGGAVCSPHCTQHECLKGSHKESSGKEGVKLEFRNEGIGSNCNQTWAELGHSLGS